MEREVIWRTEKCDYSCHLKSFVGDMACTRYGMSIKQLANAILLPYRVAVSTHPIGNVTVRTEEMKPTKLHNVIHQNRA